MERLTGREVFVRLMKRHGVEFVFGLPGATEVVLVDALEDHPEIRYILALHETACVGMAEGYTRTSGKVGVVNLHTGPGLAAALPMLSNAHQGNVPLLVTAGQQDTRLLAQEPGLAGDLAPMAAPFTKWSAEITQATDILLMVRRAFKVAATPPTGPVFLSIPQNILLDTLDYEDEPPAPVSILNRPDEESVRLAAGLLADAKSPAVIVESGVARNGAVAEAVAFAERLGAPVYQAWMSDVNFPVDHPLYLGDLDTTGSAALELLGRFDVLTVIGAPLFRQGIYQPEPLIPAGVKIIQVDDDPWQIGKNFPVAAGIGGHIRVSLQSLTSELEQHMSPAATDTAKARAEATEAEKQKADRAFADRAERERDRVPVAVTRLMSEIRDAVKPGTRIVDDCWSCSAVLRRTLGFSEPVSYQRSRSGGSIGWGLPGALGVKLASPDRPVVAVVGDGSAAWSAQSFWTAAHYNVPVTFIVCANGSYRQVRLMKDRLMGEAGRGRDLGMTLDEPRINFRAMAESLGVFASRVEQPGDLAAALRTALNLDAPSLVEVLLENA